MHDESGADSSDPSSEKCASALAPLGGQRRDSNLAPLLEKLKLFSRVRGREVRLARLEARDRREVAQWRCKPEEVAAAVKDFGEAMKILSNHIDELRPLITGELDKVIFLTRGEDHPLRKRLDDTALALGFSPDEIKWLFKEMELIDYEPMKLICPQGAEDLLALVAGTSTGENGLLLAGFVRFTGDPSVDERLENIVLRLRSKGVTANIFLVLVIVMSAYYV